MRAPMLFSSDYKHFYCRYSDPFYVKKLKLEMLTAVATETNTYDIGGSMLCIGRVFSLQQALHSCQCPNSSDRDDQ